MKRDMLQKIEDEFYSGNYDSNNLIKKSLFRYSIVYLSIMSILLIISICLHDTISILSIISPIFFYTLDGIFLGILLITIVYSILYKGKKPMFLLAFYKVYDLISFLLVTVLSISFVVMFILTPTTVIGDSMVGTLENGDKLLIWHLGYEAKNDDVVIVHVSEKYGQNESLYVKRVVASYNDKLHYDEGYVYINDVKIESVTEREYKNMTSLYYEEGSIDDFVVPNGYSIVLGDNRNNSYDSRNIGMVSNKDILGKAIFRFLPFNKMGGLKKNLS